jgi:hypothetical protein
LSQYKSIKKRQAKYARIDMGLTILSTFCIFNTVYEDSTQIFRKLREFDKDSLFLFTRNRVCVTYYLLEVISLVITVNCIHPVTGQSNSISLEVDQLSAYENSSVLSYLKRCGDGWRPYRLLEKVGGFARFHKSENYPEGRWVTLLWSMSSGITREALELTSHNRALYKSRCTFEPGAIIWVGRHFNIDNDEVYIEDAQDAIITGTTPID